LLLLCTRPQTAVHHNQLAATPRTLNAKLAVFDKMNLTKGSQLSWYKIDFVEFELKRGSRLIGSSIARLNCASYSSQAIRQNSIYAYSSNSLKLLSNSLFSCIFLQTDNAVEDNLIISAIRIHCLPGISLNLATRFNFLTM
jgi:hypothetical protein